MVSRVSSSSRSNKPRFKLRTSPTRNKHHSPKRAGSNSFMMQDPSWMPKAVKSKMKSLSQSILKAFGTQVSDAVAASPLRAYITVSPDPNKVIEVTEAQIRSLKQKLREIDDKKVKMLNRTKPVIVKPKHVQPEDLKPPNNDASFKDQHRYFRTKLAFYIGSSLNAFNILLNDDAFAKRKKSWIETLEARLASKELKESEIPKEMYLDGSWEEGVTLGKLSQDERNGVISTRKEDYDKNLKKVQEVKPLNPDQKAKIRELRNEYFKILESYGFKIYIQEANNHRYKPIDKVYSRA